MNIYVYFYLVSLHMYELLPPQRTQSLNLGQACDALLGFVLEHADERVVVHRRIFSFFF